MAGSFERPARRSRVHAVVKWLRWLVLAATVAMIVMFLVAQGQRADVRYGQSPAAGTIADESALLFAAERRAAAAYTRLLDDVAADRDEETDYRALTHRARRAALRNGCAR